VCYILRYSFLRVNLTAAVVKLEAPRLASFPSETTVTIQLFPPTSSSNDHVTHYYVVVVPANLRVASSDVKLDEVRHSPHSHLHLTASEFLMTTYDMMN